MCGNRRRLWLISLKTTMATMRGQERCATFSSFTAFPSSSCRSLAGFLANSHLASNCEWRNEL